MAFFRCDVCVKGPPEKQDLNGEALLLMQIIAAHYVSNILLVFSCIHMPFRCVMCRLISKLTYGASLFVVVIMVYEYGDN